MNKPALKATVKVPYWEEGAEDPIGYSNGVVVELRPLGCMVSLSHNFVAYYSYVELEEYAKEAAK
jgi:hypothetical protein